VIAVALPVPAPADWDATSYRACELCDHRMYDGTDLVCCCPAAVASDRWRPVTVMRASHGGCGPDARFMRIDFDSLHA
jgi:hypothetical protein